MLNDRLYTALQRAFGDVLVANEREPGTIIYGVESAVGRVLKKKQATIVGYGEQYRVNCPFCIQYAPFTPDTHKHLWISHLFDTPVNYAGKLYEFGWSPAKCYRRDCLRDIRNKRVLMAMIKNLKPATNFVITNSDLKETYNPEKPPKIPMPPTLALDDEGVPEFVHEYLRSRGVTAEELKRDWGASIGFIDFYERPALIFPIWQRNEYVSWQARYIGEDMEQFHTGEEKPKYYIPKQTKKSWLVYNMDRAKFNTPGVLVEGIFDAIKVGPNHGVAMFGKIPSTYQLRILSSLFGETSLVWIPDENDPDSVAVATKTAMELISKKIMKNVKVARLPYGDPGTFTRSELWEIINSAPALQ